MTEPHEEEVVRHETAVGPAEPPVSRTTVTSVRSAYPSRAILAVWWVVGLVESILAIRFLFKLLGASLEASFVRLIYDITAPLVAPFHGIFNTAAEGRSILEPESLVAMLIYWLIGLGIVSLMGLLGPSRHPHTDAV